jgi:hypothetical protein
MTLACAVAAVFPIASPPAPHRLTLSPPFYSVQYLRSLHRIRNMLSAVSILAHRTVNRQPSTVNLIAYVQIEWSTYPVEWTMSLDLAS